MSRRIAASVVAMVVASLCWVAAASAEHVQCGATITQSITLDSDLTDCPPPHAIRIEGLGITVDLGGHTVDGTGDGRGVTTFHEGDAGATVVNGRVMEFETGIRLSAGFGLTVRNVTVSDNFTGIQMSDGGGAVIEGVTATRHTAAAIQLTNLRNPLVRRNRLFGNAGGIGGGLILGGTFERNHIHDNEFGGFSWVSFREAAVVDNDISDNGTYGMFFTDWTANNVFKSNRLVGNGTDGLFIDDFTGPNTVERNTANGNGDDGLDIDYAGSTLTRNKANRNGDLGIEAVPGTIDGGKNEARQNGNPAQCTGVSCN